MKTLTLTIMKPYFDAILAGSKKIEYRENKPYWQHRLRNKDYDRVEFINGYGNHRPRFTCRVFSIEETPEQFKIHLGDIIRNDF